MEVVLNVPERGLLLKLAVSALVNSETVRLRGTVPVATVTVTLEGDSVLSGGDDSGLVPEGMLVVTVPVRGLFELLKSSLLIPVAREAV